MEIEYDDAAEGNHAVFVLVVLAVAAAIVGLLALTGWALMAIAEVVA